MSLRHLFIGHKKFDFSVRPWKTPWYLIALEGIIMCYYSVIAGMKVKKDEKIKKSKGPYLVLQNHGSFVDFGLTLKAFYPKRMSWVSSIEEFNRGEWLMRSLGCFGKRKFTSDVTVVKNILHAIRKNKTSVTIFPEARFALAGINEEIDSKSYARLIKLAKVPVLVGIAKGNFIRSPQYHKRPYKNIPAEITFTEVISAEETQTLSADEISKRLEDAFIYDDYKYWQESGRKIKSKWRAHNIHKVLYQCPHCKKEFTMNSYGNELFCTDCGKKWHLSERGFLESVDGGEPYFTHVPDWYRWQRKNVETEVNEGRYSYKTEARIERLVTASQGFKQIGGNVTLTHDEKGFTVSGKLDNGEDFYLNRSVESMYSVHIEYNYKKRGDAIDLATTNETYFVYPLNNDNIVTKLHYATEALYQKKTGDHVNQEEN